MNFLHIIGKIKDYGDIIVVANDYDIPIENFSNWQKVYNWLNANDYKIKGNIVCK